jgi:hypothetical protein
MCLISPNLRSKESESIKRKRNDKKWAENPTLTIYERELSLAIKQSHDYSYSMKQNTY